MYFCLMYWVLLCLSSGTDLQKSWLMLESLSLCNKVLSLSPSLPLSHCVCVCVCVHARVCMRVCVHVWPVICPIITNIPHNIRYESPSCHYVHSGATVNSQTLAFKYVKMNEFPDMNHTFFCSLIFIIFYSQHEHPK